MIGFERIWTGRGSTVDICDACQVLILPGDGRSIFADDDQHLITLCPACHVLRMDAGVPKQWPAANTIPRRARRG